MKACLGESLIAYIRRQYMERVALYIQTQKIKWKELAGRVGYKTPQSFSKAFNKYFGRTPATFKDVFFSNFMLKRKDAGIKEKYQSVFGERYECFSPNYQILNNTSRELSEKFGIPLRMQFYESLVYNQPTIL